MVWISFLDSLGNVLSASHLHWLVSLKFREGMCETVTNKLHEDTKVNDIIPDEGSMICPPGKFMIDYKKGVLKTILNSGQTWLP